MSNVNFIRIIRNIPAVRKPSALRGKQGMSHPTNHFLYHSPADALRGLLVEEGLGKFPAQDSVSIEKRKLMINFHPNCEVHSFYYNMPQK